jgi:hypothetical protein
MLAGVCRLQVLLFYLDRRDDAFTSDAARSTVPTSIKPLLFVQYFAHDRHVLCQTLASVEASVTMKKVFLQRFFMTLSPNQVPNQIRPK